MVGQVTSLESPIRVLVVDDSAFMRFTIAKHLGEVARITVVGTARNGVEALELITKLNPDVVTLDVAMPHMDGLTTLREIMSRQPLPVVMLSNFTCEGAWETVQALTLGAVDFVTKPDTKANIATVMDDVVAKVQRAAQCKVFKCRQMPSGSDRILPLPSTLVNKSSQPPHRQKTTRPITTQDKVLVIGASTGGPHALNIVVPDLSAKMTAAVLIVQHMPVGFTCSLAERLDATSQLVVKEAAHGDKLEVGRALVAPGGFHMMIDDGNQITLDQSPPVHGVRPSVDVTMISVAQRFGASVVGAILTGMGSDGTNGAKLVRNVGGWIIAEDESTSVVWGMPRSVFEAGAANEVVPLHNLASAIHKAISAHR